MEYVHLCKNPSIQDRQWINVLSCSYTILKGYIYQDVVFLPNEWICIENEFIFIGYEWNLNLFVLNLTQIKATVNAVNFKNKKLSQFHLGQIRIPCFPFTNSSVSVFYNINISWLSRVVAIYYVHLVAALNVKKS